MTKSYKKKFIAIDLFSRCRRTISRTKKAGFNVVADVEIDIVAVEIYEMNHRKHILYREKIRNIDPDSMLSDLNIKVGELNLLAGCPPYQDFSSYRTRNKTTSVKDRRNNLVYELYSFVEVMMPKSIMMENVPGLAKDHRMDKLKTLLMALGYIFNEDSITIKDVSDYRISQRRRRMILLVSRFGNIDQPKPYKNKKTVFEAIGSLVRPGNSGDVLHDYPARKSEHVKSLIKLIPKDGGSRSDLPKKYWLPCHLQCPDGDNDVYGRMSWDKVSPATTGACTNPSKERFLHPGQNRAITIREATLLQSFPAHYKFSLKKGKDHASLMIGNALPSEFIKCHAKSIIKHPENVF